VLQRTSQSHPARFDATKADFFAAIFLKTSNLVQKYGA
jgi:hypothetical protein